MRYIAKTNEPAVLSKYIRDYERKNNRKPVYANLDVATRSNIRDALIDEQCFICAYCMGGIDAEDAHIETDDNGKLLPFCKAVEWVFKNS
jgi:hypothetical protein